MKMCEFGVYDSDSAIRGAIKIIENKETKKDNYNVIKILLHQRLFKY